jgi:hypothetical protein
VRYSEPPLLRLPVALPRQWKAPRWHEAVGLLLLAVFAAGAVEGVRWALGVAEAFRAEGPKLLALLDLLARGGLWLLRQGIH